MLRSGLSREFGFLNATLSPAAGDSLEMMSEEDLHRPSYQTNFQVEVNGQVQVQVQAKTVHWVNLSKRGGKDGVFRGLAPRH